MGELYGYPKLKKMKNLSALLSTLKKNIINKTF